MKIPCIRGMSITAQLANPRAARVGAELWHAESTKFETPGAHIKTGKPPASAQASADGVARLDKGKTPGVSPISTEGGLANA